MIDAFAWAEAASRYWGWSTWRLLECLEAAQRKTAEEILGSDSIYLSIDHVVSSHLAKHPKELNRHGKAGELLYRAPRSGRDGLQRAKAARADRNESDAAVLTGGVSATTWYEG